MQPHPKPNEQQSMAVANGVIQVDQVEPLQLLVANFSKKPARLTKNELVATVLPHPTTVVTSPISIGEVLGVTEESQRHSAESSNSTDRQSPVHEHNSRRGGQGKVEQTKENQESTPLTVDDLDLSHGPEALRGRFREMMRKLSKMWDGSLEEINTTEHRIELLAGTRPTAQPPRRAAPRAREIA